MDLKNAKDNLVYYKKVLENSLKMCNTTIKEMITNKANQEALSFAIQMRNDTYDQIKDIDAALENINKNKKADFAIAFNAVVEKFKTFNPYGRNRFVVDFENDEIKDFFVESVSYSKDRLCIRFRYSENFFVPEYFEKNKWFENVRVFLLSPVGEKKAMITFYRLNVEDFVTDELTYKSDEVLGTNVMFTFEKVIHTSNVKKIEKDPQ